MASATNSKNLDAPGVISADSLYTLAEIQQRLKLGQAAMRQARLAGLRVVKIGRRRYVLGRDLISFIDSTTATN